ncbi:MULTISPECIES: hypothetical protein [Halorussus]|uniref:Uncharacterized protein n=2 Tax=Halorussus TaxID=1070314 RepID=A0A8U0HU94_9EURY|nr:MULTISPECIES: hypothetical protein [Halorussus]UPV74580.1 hypothetical protein M0R89_00580 [Halorussus limi]
MSTDIDRITESTDKQSVSGDDLTEATLERLHELEQENERLRKEKEIARQNLHTVEDERRDLACDVELLEAENQALRREQAELVRRIVLDEGSVMGFVNEIVEGKV